MFVSGNTVASYTYRYMETVIAFLLYPLLLAYPVGFVVLFVGLVRRVRSCDDETKAGKARSLLKKGALLLMIAMLASIVLMLLADWNS